MAHCKHRVMDRCKKTGLPCTFGSDCFEPEEQTAKTNADCIRAMSDEELADSLVIKIDGLRQCSLYISLPSGKMFISRSKAVRVTLEWLRQTEEDVF